MTPDPYAALAELVRCADAAGRGAFPESDGYRWPEAWAAARAALAQRAEPVACGHDSRILHELAGAASLCWVPKPTGVFDSQAAIAHVENALRELRESCAAPQAQHVSGAADPVGEPAGEQTGPVSAAPTYKPEDAQPKPLSDEQIRDLVKECGLDWHRGFAPLFDGDETNRYAVFARAIERAVTERLRGQS